MAINHIIRCDHPQCDRVRGEANHWFIASAIEPGRILIQRWEDSTPEDIAQAGKHYCGPAHMLAAVSRWTEGKP